jgi:hypothetical protein
MILVRINHPCLRVGCHILTEANLHEIHLSGRLFTWSNERMHPTLELIDRAFISNHASLLLHTRNEYMHHKRFHFRAYWPKFPGFLEMVEKAWLCPLTDADPCRRLDWLLRNTARVLKSWSDRCIGNIRSQLEVAKEVVHRLEMARDRR